MPKKRGRPTTRRNDLAAAIYMMMYSRDSGERRARKLARAAIKAGIVKIPDSEAKGETNSVLQRLERMWGKYRRKFVK